MSIKEIIKMINEKYDVKCNNIEECIQNIASILSIRVVFNVDPTEDVKLKALEELLEMLESHYEMQRIMSFEMEDNEKRDNNEKIIFNSLEEIKDYYEKKYDEEPTEMDLLNFICHEIENGEVELFDKNKFKIFEELHSDISYSIEEEDDGYYIMLDDYDDDQSTFLSSLCLLAYILNIEDISDILNIDEEMESFYTFKGKRDLNKAEMIIKLINENKFKELYKKVKRYAKS